MLIIANRMDAGSLSLCHDKAIIWGTDLIFATGRARNSEVSTQ